MNGKQAAGQHAVTAVHDGMIVGLGTGSTVYYFLEALAKKVADGLKITGVATSQRTIDLAQEQRIPMESLNSVSHIDVTIDGVDEFTADLDGIKGGGGALLYEKLVAKSSDRCIWIADSSKKVERLGAFPLPVEVVPFGWKQLFRTLDKKGYEPVLRTEKEGSPFLTDAQHYILDLQLHAIKDPAALANELDHLSGVVEHGLFLDTTDQIFIGYPDGHVETIRKR